VLTGQVPSREIEEKLVLAVGNTAGLGSVDDRLQVVASSASAPATSPSAAALSAAQSVFYTVKKGDNLSTIAKEQYGNASKYMAIFEANKPMLKDPDKSTSVRCCAYRRNHEQRESRAHVEREEFCHARA
jgi:nucleoid-associated protein YgaU